MSAPVGLGDDTVDDDRPRGAVFWVAAGVGWVVMAFGVWGLFDNEGNTKPALLVRWVLGTLLVHDLLIVPVVIAVGALVGWLLPPRWRGPVRGALALSALAVLFSYPLWRGFGRRPGDPSALPLDYADSLLVVLAVIWVGAAAVLVARWGRARR